MRKGSRRMAEEASLTFPFFAHRNRVLVRCVGMREGEEHWHRKGRSSSAWRAHPALSPPATVSLQRDSVTLQLIHMQKAHMKAPNEERINYSLIRLLFF